MFTVKMADHYGNQRCDTEKNVPTAFILTNVWQYRDESLGIETTSCLWNDIDVSVGEILSTILSQLYLG